MWTYYYLFAVSTLQEELQDLYTIPLQEHEVNVKKLKEDLLGFLDLHMYNQQRTSVLVLCNSLCISELLHQVTLFDTNRNGHKQVLKML